MTPHLRKILVKFRESLPHPLKLKRELIVGLAKPGEAELRKRHREQRRRRQHAKLSDGNKQQQHRGAEAALRLLYSLGMLLHTISNFHHPNPKLKCESKVGMKYGN